MVNLALVPSLQPNTGILVSLSCKYTIPYVITISTSNSLGAVNVIDNDKFELKNVSSKAIYSVEEIKDGYTNNTLNKNGLTMTSPDPFSLQLAKQVYVSMPNVENCFKTSDMLNNQFMYCFTKDQLNSKYFTIYKQFSNTAIFIQPYYSDGINTGYFDLYGIVETTVGISAGSVVPILKENQIYVLFTGIYFDNAYDSETGLLYLNDNIYLYAKNDIPRGTEIDIQFLISSHINSGMSGYSGKLIAYVNAKKSSVKDVMTVISLDSYAEYAENKMVEPEPEEPEPDEPEPAAQSPEPAAQSPEPAAQSPVVIQSYEVDECIATYDKVELSSDRFEQYSNESTLQYVFIERSALDRWAEVSETTNTFKFHITKYDATITLLREYYTTPMFDGDIPIGFAIYNHSESQNIELSPTFKIFKTEHDEYTDGNEDLLVYFQDYETLSALGCARLEIHNITFSKMFNATSEFTEYDQCEFKEQTLYINLFESQTSGDD